VRVGAWRPRAHLTRYFGVFAPAFAARAKIVPATPSAGPALAAAPGGRGCVAGGGCYSDGERLPADVPPSISVGVAHLALLPEGCPRVRTLQRPHADRGRAHRAARDRARPVAPGPADGGASGAPRPGAAADGAAVGRRPDGVHVLSGRPARRRQRRLKRRAGHPSSRFHGSQGRGASAARGILVFPAKTGILGVSGRSRS
jgi:hypothetical protein